MSDYLFYSLVQMYVLFVIALIKWGVRTSIFGSIVYSQAKVHIHQNFLIVVVHVIIIDQWNQTTRLYEIQVKVIFFAVLFLSLWCQSAV